VFYATDRAPLGEDVIASSRGGWERITTFYLWSVVAAVAAALLIVTAVFVSRRWRWPAVLVAGLLLAAAVWQWQAGSVAAQRRDRATIFGDRVYGSGRHEVDGQAMLEVGVCAVGIPPDHRVGRLESPSLLRFEVTEDPQKHVIIRRTLHKPEQEFYAELRDVVSRSDEDEAFVFIHGYNVSFENAVRRTAQMAYDLKFNGAPVCYSWPSQGELASYTYDESSIDWTAVQLETFLDRLRRDSGARKIHLIAHSMGNRILVQALERMALRSSGEQDASRRFGQIVMAAPDIDAGAFRNRYAPLVAQMGRRVTMYASSNDKALEASLKIHGYDRAGLSGEHLVIVPGLDTVDASPIDTSLIGHSYYGDNPLMIRDLRTLIDENTPAEARRWLRRMLYRTDTHYWAFLHEPPPVELLPPEASPTSPK
jgi:esterase/lipase superfamily enzyme